MDKTELKAMCKFARAFNIYGAGENFAYWRKAILRSQEQGLNYVDYAPSCSLKSYVANITNILCYHFYSNQSRYVDYIYKGEQSKYLEPLIGEALGYIQR